MYEVTVKIKPRGHTKMRVVKMTKARRVWAFIISPQALAALAMLMLLAVAGMRFQ